jgi:stearoyl-CoA desaturase (Delta-9 desaturase)
MRQAVVENKMTPARRRERQIALLVVCLPLAGFVGAVAASWGGGITAADLGLCLGLAVLTLLGITAGYHRLFTHRSFEAHPSVRWLLGVAGSMAAQGPILFWVACHRRHHQHSDADDDPHSPHGTPATFRKGVIGGKVILPPKPGPLGVPSPVPQPVLRRGQRGWGQMRGLWHAHVGWMFHHEPEAWGRYVPDLLRDNLAFRINQTYFLWVLLGLLAPGLLGGILAGSWLGFVRGVCWGGLVRAFLVHHVTWSINSICHTFGSAPYDTDDHSRNNVVCAVLALGEGWHNNHHAFPNSARHGLAWWQLDVTYLVIRLLQAVRLVWNVKVPTAGSLKARRKLGDAPVQAPLPWKGRCRGRRPSNSDSNILQRTS